MAKLLERDEFKAYKNAFERRVTALSKRSAYYDGSVYRETSAELGWLQPRWLKGVRPLYLPLARAVDVDAGIIPGGWALDEEKISQSQAKAFQAAIGTVFAWSDWQTDGVLYVHYGAQYGVSGLKIAAPGDGRVIVQPVDPTLFLLIPKGTYQTTPAMSIWVERRLDPGGTEFEYGEVITPEGIRTFKDGQPMGFDERAPEYENALGFVPFVEVRHMETGQPYGEATYQKVIPLLDEVNTLATYLAGVIKRNAEPQWAAIGVEPSELTHSGNKMWFFPMGAEVKILVPDIDIDGVLAFVQDIKSDLKDGLPELAFDELKSKDQIATATIELQLAELVLKIRRCRPNYDHGLADALRMAGRAAAVMGAAEVVVLDDEALAFDDKRPVLPMDRLTEIEIEQAELALEQARGVGVQEGEGDVPDTDEQGDGAEGVRPGADGAEGSAAG